MVTAMITFASMLWVSNLAFSSLRGAYKLREAGEVDWNSLLEDLQNKDLAVPHARGLSGTPADASAASAASDAHQLRGAIRGLVEESMCGGEGWNK